MMVHPGQQDDRQRVIAQLKDDEQLSASGAGGMRRASLGSGYRCITHRSCSGKSSKSQDQLRPPRLRHVDEHATHGSRAARQVVAASRLDWSCSMTRDFRWTLPTIAHLPAAACTVSAPGSESPPGRGGGAEHRDGRVLFVFAVVSKRLCAPSMPSMRWVRTADQKLPASTEAGQK
jgi:hypothetical protein